MRQREFGIRKALGATASLLTWMLVRETSQTLLMGAALGIGVGILIGLVFSRPGLNLRLFDPVVILGVASGLYAGGLLSAILPYVKAMRGAGVRLQG